MNKNNDYEITNYLTFRLDEEMFATQVANVREVLDMCTIRKVPRAPDFMRGVINVRGNVVPVVDMRIKFGMAETENTVDTRIIVMDLDIDGEKIVLGALADSVHEVIELDDDQIEDPPKIGSKWRTENIKGIGKYNDDFIMILDMASIFSSKELPTDYDVNYQLEDQVENAA